MPQESQAAALIRRFREASPSARRDRDRQLETWWEKSESNERSRDSLRDWSNKTRLQQESDPTDLSMSLSIEPRESRRLGLFPKGGGLGRHNNRPTLTSGSFDIDMDVNKMLSSFQSDRSDNTLGSSGVLGLLRADLKLDGIKSAKEQSAAGIDADLPAIKENLEAILKAMSEEVEKERNQMLAVGPIDVAANLEMQLKGFEWFSAELGDDREEKARQARDEEMKQMGREEERKRQLAAVLDNIGRLEEIPNGGGAIQHPHWFASYRGLGQYHPHVVTATTSSIVTHPGRHQQDEEESLLPLGTHRQVGKVGRSVAKSLNAVIDMLQKNLEIDEEDTEDEDDEQKEGEKIDVALSQPPVLIASPIVQIPEASNWDQTRSTSVRVVDEVVNGAIKQIQALHQQQDNPGLPADYRKVLDKIDLTLGTDDDVGAARVAIGRLKKSSSERNCIFDRFYPPYGSGPLPAKPPTRTTTTTTTAAIPSKRNLFDNNASFGVPSKEYFEFDRPPIVVRASTDEELREKEAKRTSPASEKKIDISRPIWLTRDNYYPSYNGPTAARAQPEASAPILPVTSSEAEFESRLDSLSRKASAHRQPVAIEGRAILKARSILAEEEKLRRKQQIREEEEREKMILRSSLESNGLFVVPPLAKKYIDVDPSLEDRKGYLANMQGLRAKLAKAL